MRVILFVFITIVFLSSCGKRKNINTNFKKAIINNEIKKSPINFETIDITVIYDSTYFYSLKILKDGKTYFCNHSKVTNMNNCYILILNKSRLDTISTLVNEILKSNLDSSSDNDIINRLICDHLGWYGFTISTNKRKIKISHLGNFLTGYLNSYDCLADNLDLLASEIIQSFDLNKKLYNKTMHSIDSNIIFESMKQYNIDKPKNFLLPSA